MIYSIIYEVIIICCTISNLIISNPVSETKANRVIKFLNVRYETKAEFKTDIKFLQLCYGLSTGNKTRNWIRHKRKLAESFACSCYNFGLIFPAPDSFRSTGSFIHYITFSLLLLRLSSRVLFSIPSRVSKRLQHSTIRLNGLVKTGRSHLKVGSVPTPFSHWWWWLMEIFTKLRTLTGKSVEAWCQRTGDSSCCCCCFE